MRLMPVGYDGNRIESHAVHVTSIAATAACSDSVQSIKRSSYFGYNAYFYTYSLRQHRITSFI